MECVRCSLVFLPLSEKLDARETVELIERQGFQRVWWKGQLMRLSEWMEQIGSHLPAGIEIVVDRVRLEPDWYPRFVEAVEQAYQFGKGVIQIRVYPPDENGRAYLFSNKLHCAACDIEYEEPQIGLFSFNHPLGACPRCRGFGRTIEVDYRLAIPDPTRTLRECPVEPWRSGIGRECYRDMIRVCRERGFRSTCRLSSWILKHSDLLLKVTLTMGLMRNMNGLAVGMVFVVIFNGWKARRISFISGYCCQNIGSIKRALHATAHAFGKRLFYIN